MKEIVVIGIGQELRGDDAVGPEIVRGWKSQHPQSAEHVRVEISPLPGLELLDLFEGADTVILVDAVQSGDKPGTVHIVGMDQLISFEAGSGSVHGFGVAETLALGRQADPESIPETVIVIGVEALQMDLGAPISPEIQASIPVAISELERLIRKYFT